MERKSSEYFRLGIRQKGHVEEYLEDRKEKEAGLTIKVFLLKKYPWYYLFDSLCADYPIVNLAGLVKFDQPAQHHDRKVQDENFNSSNEIEAGEIFSPIKNSLFGPDMQSTADVKENIEIIYSSLYSTLSQIAKDDCRNKWHE